MRADRPRWPPRRARLAEAGQGAPPCRYAVAVLGSAGRGESLLALDQDNALVFEHDAEGADAWFAAFGSRLADLLHEAGVPYCTGGVMASNPQWRGSLATWRARIAQWIGTSDPGALLSVDIFFDLRGVHGDRALANGVWARCLRPGRRARSVLPSGWRSRPARSSRRLGLFGACIRPRGAST